MAGTNGRSEKQLFSITYTKLDVVDRNVYMNTGKEKVRVIYEYE